MGDGLPRERVATRQVHGGLHLQPGGGDRDRIEADQVATALRKYMESVAGFEGNASDLLQALNGVVSEMEQKAKGWPKRPQALGGILRRVATPLRKVGVEITFNREGKRRDRRSPSPS